MNNIQLEFQVISWRMPILFKIIKKKKEWYLMCQKMIIVIAIIILPSQVSRYSLVSNFLVL